MKENILSARRQELVDQIRTYREIGYDQFLPEHELRIRFDAANDRLVSIDALEAQSRLARSQEQLAASQHEAAEAQAAETKRLEQVRALSDSQSFWFRRFLTSLTVAHGAGAFAALTSMMRTPPPIATPAQVENILWCFLTGLFFMGSLPIVYALVNPEKPDPKRLKNSTPVAWLFAGISTFLLAVGVLTVIQVAQATYDHNLASKAQVTGVQNANMRKPVATASGSN